MDEHGNRATTSSSARCPRAATSAACRATTGRVIDVFDAVGYDVVIVETVGAGQSEVEIRHFADSNIVVCPPGLGDEVQAIKAGILEIADLLVVNKADLPQAERTVLDLTTAVHLRHRSDWQVKVLRTVATSGEGVPALVDAIEEHGRATGIGKRLKQASPAPAPQATDEELFAQLRRWRAAGKGVALATVVKTWGSSPRPEGSHLAVEAGGAFVGSVSGGCIEGAVIGEAQAAIADGQPRLLEFGVSDERAWEVGLACGGRVQVFVERVNDERFERLLAERAAKRAVTRRHPTRRRRAGAGGRRRDQRRTRTHRGAARRDPPPLAQRQERHAGILRRRRCSRAATHKRRAWSSSAPCTSPRRWRRWRRWPASRWSSSIRAAPSPPRSACPA